jgi:hypothetical protein
MIAPGLHAARHRGWHDDGGREGRVGTAGRGCRIVSHVQRPDLPGGFAFRFAADGFENVARFVLNTRRCCPLRFEIDSAVDDGSARLRLTGPAALGRSWDRARDARSPAPGRRVAPVSSRALA